MTLAGLRSLKDATTFKEEQQVQGEAYRIHIEREDRLQRREAEEEAIVASFGTFEWEVVELRAQHQLQRVSELVDKANGVAAIASASGGLPASRHKSRHTHEEEARDTARWRLSVKLVRKIEHLNILLEVLQAQQQAHPIPEAALRKKVLAARASAEQAQGNLFNLLTH